MKAQGVRLIAAAFVAAGIAGCFSDPTSSMRNGPATMVLTRTAAVIASGDSTLVEARLEDAAGNLLPITGATWTTDNASVADVHLAGSQAPEDASSRAYVVGLDTTGGVTYIRIAARGLSDSIRVATEPAHKVFPAGVVSVVGDTLIITASADLAFDATASLVHEDNPAVRDSPAVTTYLLSRSASQLRVLFREPVTNYRAWVTHVLLSGGNAASAVPLDSFTTSESLTIARATLPAASVSIGSSATYGAGSILTIKPPTGWTLDPASAGTLLGTEVGKVLSRSADSIVVLSTHTGGYANGTILAENLRVTAGGAVDSLRTSGNFTVAQARLPDASLTVGTSATYGPNTLLTIKPPSGTTFNAFTSTVRFTAANGRILFRSADSIVVLATATGGYTGTASVSNVVSTATGGGTIDSLRNTTGVTVAQALLPDAQVTVRNGALGANTEVKVTPPAGTVFSVSGAVSNVVFGASTGTALVRTPDSIVAILSTSYTGPISVTNAVSTLTGGGVIDKLTTAGSFTSSAAAFPGTIVQKGTGLLLDTIEVIGGAIADFTTSGASASNVSLNGARALVMRRAADTLYIIAAVPGTSTVSVTNVKVGTATIPSLLTSGTTTVSAVTGEANEPGNDASATATAVTVANVGDSAIVYGAMDGTTDVRDYYKFTMPGGAASNTVSVQLAFFGDGSGSDDLNPDFDVVVCTTLSGAGSCSYGQDIIPGNAASATNQPEQGTTAAVVGGTTVYVRTFEYFATGAGIGAYRLRIKTP